METQSMLPTFHSIRSQRKPNYLWWWLVYQGFFIVATAGIVIMLIHMKDEKYGLLSYLKNYIFRLLITLFVAIYIGFVSLLIYFFLNVLSLFSFLKKNRKGKTKTKSRPIIATSQINLMEDAKAQSTTSSSGSLQMIPVSIEGSAEGGKENSKFFIIHV
jgi:hypothetical protein